MFFLGGGGCECVCCFVLFFIILVYMEKFCGMFRKYVKIFCFFYLCNQFKKLVLLIFCQCFNVFVEFFCFFQGVGGWRILKCELFLVVKNWSFWILNVNFLVRREFLGQLSVFVFTSFCLLVSYFVLGFVCLDIFFGI